MRRTLTTLSFLLMAISRHQEKDGNLKQRPVVLLNREKVVFVGINVAGISLTEYHTRGKKEGKEYQKHIQTSPSVFGSIPSGDAWSETPEVWYKTSFWKK